MTRADSRLITRPRPLLATLVICVCALLTQPGQVLSAPRIVSSYPDRFADAAVNPDVIALGDSFAAGEGARSYLDVSNGRDNQCHRSKNAHSLQFADTKWSVSFHACSGASTNDYWNQNQNKGLDRPVLRGKPERPQRAWFEQATPNLKLVTATFGGNDVGFAKIVKACITGKLSLNSFDIDCDDAISEWSKKVPSLRPKLGAVYRDIASSSLKSGAIPRPAVLVLGYPRMFPDDPPPRCGLGAPALGRLISRKSMRALNQFVVDVNDQVALSATDAGVTYVNVESSLQRSKDGAKPEDHGLCADRTKDPDKSKERWVNRLIPSDYKQRSQPEPPPRSTCPAALL